MAFGRFFFFEMEYGMCAASACTRYEYLSFIFRVEVDKPITRHKSAFHARCTSHLRFFVACENAFQRTVFDVVAFQHGQLHSHANTVVGTKGCALSLQPFAVNIALYGVLVKVELHVNQLVAHHICMALQYNNLSVFVARCSRLTYVYVVHCVYFHV